MTKIELPDGCECGFENLKIWGTRIRGNVSIEVRCMSCGKVLWEMN